jgi:hypothetical protein
MNTVDSLFCVRVSVGAAGLTRLSIYFTYLLLSRIVPRQILNDDQKQMISDFHSCDDVKLTRQIALLAIVRFKPTPYTGILDMHSRSVHRSSHRSLKSVASVSVSMCARSLVMFHSSSGIGARLNASSELDSNGRGKRYRVWSKVKQRRHSYLFPLLCEPSTLQLAFAHRDIARLRLCAILAQMATPRIPTDAEVTKQVRQCLSIDEADDVTVGPRALRRCTPC